MCLVKPYRNHKQIHSQLYSTHIHVTTIIHLQSSSFLSLSIPNFYFFHLLYSLIPFSFSFYHIISYHICQIFYSFFYGKNLFIIFSVFQNNYFSYGLEKVKGKKAMNLEEMKTVGVLVPHGSSCFRLS